MRKVHTRIVDFGKSKYNSYAKKRMETKDIMKKIKDDLGDYINKEIGRSPMVIPMYVYISRDGATKTAPVAKKDKEEEVVGMTLEEQGGER